jgi:hypothetical protein
MDKEVICSQCGTPKPLSEFSPRHDRKIGHASECKECGAKRRRKYVTTHPKEVREQVKQRYWRDPEKYRKLANEWGKENRARKTAYNRELEKKNPERRRLKAQRYRLTHPEWAHDRRRRYNKQNPEKAGAHDAVKRAVQAGKLPPVKTLICAHCKIRQADNYHHHKGYAKEHWLDVKPLCYFCHSAADRAQDQNAH